MKQKLSIAIAVLTFIFFAVATRAMQASAQQPTPTPGEPVPTPTLDLERRIYELEVAQTQAVRSLERINEQYRSVLIGAGALITLLVGIQGLATGAATVAQFRQDRRQELREQKRDQIDYDGIDRVGKVLDVIRETLDNQRRATKQALDAQKQTQKVLEQFKSLEQFYRNFQATIKRSREAIEDHASRLVEANRHIFRRMTDELSSFTQQFDKFETDFEALEEKREGELSPGFSPRALYIRGIAAHYANQPEIAGQFLDRVTKYQQPVGETPEACNRRLANAYYYLGLIQSNFGNSQDAIELFEKANKLDLHDKDHLAMLATADTHVMMGNFDEARRLAGEVERGGDLRLQSRATLIKANMLILEQKPNWQAETQSLLESVHDVDPEYYYATATLAQVYLEQDKEAEAQALFNEAYTAIDRCNDLNKVAEARSRILLLMVDAMCCKHGPEDEAMLKVRLREARELLSSLPKMGHQTCTVFSTLSKRNEYSDAIRSHIESIQKGDVLLLQLGIGQGVVAATA